MNLFNTKVNEIFQSKSAIKVITGINNSNIDQILKITKAAEQYPYTYVDIIANTNIVRLVKSVSPITVCVSSINPIDLYNCVLAGADLVEIGNFDPFYKKGLYFSSSDILEIAKKVKFLVGNIDICVTIPYYLPLKDQINLAQDLEKLGVSLLQTESLFIKNKKYISDLYKDSIYESISLAALSFLSTYAISKQVEVPIIASSSVSSLSSPLAIFFGASGVGIGSCIRQKNNIFQMSAYINEIYRSLSSLGSINSIEGGSYFNSSRTPKEKLKI
uniref:Uncharacterized protein ycf23 n=1 Tax=Alsidium seaforthii TaxID=2007182 RepID=A0A1Z1MDK6_9FLOR|nr:hypothetical protein [Bryothamnion seaforthii]ARW63895.1 hypothetical protein [Bryothamnion seaforthii]